MTTTATLHLATEVAEMMLRDDATVGQTLALIGRDLGFTDRLIVNREVLAEVLAERGYRLDERDFAVEIAPADDADAALWAEELARRDGVHTLTGGTR